HRSRRDRPGASSCGAGDGIPSWRASVVRSGFRPALDWSYIRPRSSNKWTGTVTCAVRSPTLVTLTTSSARGSPSIPVTRLARSTVTLSGSPRKPQSGVVLPTSAARALATGAVLSPGGGVVTLVGVAEPAKEGLVGDGVDAPVGAGVVVAAGAPSANRSLSRSTISPASGMALICSSESGAGATG